MDTNSKTDSSKVINFKEYVEYSENGIISKRIIDRAVGNVTLFSFDRGQRLSEHSAPFDALVQIIEGNAEIIINKEVFNLNEGNSIIMPANIPHAVNAVSRFKMLLTMIKG